MRKKLSKLLVVFAFFATVAIGNLSPLTASAAADTCTWTGATSANWATGSNWSGCDNGGVPENVDVLIFPESAANKATNNNLVGLAPDSIVFQGSGYSIAGNAFTLIGTTPITANESATISADVHYESGSHMTIRPAAGKTLTLSGVSDFFLTSFYEVNIGATPYTGTVDFTGNITGSAGSQFIAQNGARAIVGGAGNTYTASTVGAESGGKFQCESSACFGDSANDIYMGGGIVSIETSATFSNDIVTSTTTPNNSMLAADEDTSITGGLTVNDDLQIHQLAAGKNIQFTGAGTLDGSIDVYGNNTSSNIKFNGALSGAGNVTVNSGNAWMAGSHSFTGTVTVKSGAVAMANQINSLGASSAPTVIEDGGTLNIDASSPAAIAEPIQVEGEGVSPVSFKGAIYMASTSKSVELSGAITLTDDTTIYNEAEGEDLNLSGAIGGTGNLSYVSQWDSLDSGSITVDGAAPNTYNGNTTVLGGVTYFEKTGAIPGDLTVDSSDDTGISNRAHAYFYVSSNVLSDTGVITMGSDAYSSITFGANDEVIGGLQGARGTVQIQDDGDRLIIDQDINTGFKGSFYTDGGIATIEKRGTGNLALNGPAANNSDKITFIAKEGTLTVNDNIKTTTGGDVEVAGGTLKGRGTTGDVTTNGGTIAPGTSPGKLTVGSLTLDPTNTVEFELDGPVAGTSYDQIESSGAVNLANATLSIKPSYTPAAGEEFIIITGSYVTGTFKNLPNNATITVNGITFKVVYGEASVSLIYVSGTYDPNANDALVNTGTGMLLAAIASIMLIAAATALTARRQRNAVL